MSRRRSDSPPIPLALTRRGFLALLAASAVGCAADEKDLSPTDASDASDASDWVTPEDADVAPIDVPEPIPDIEVPEISADPFTLGVGSGDALDDRVILWTRLAPEPTWNGGMPDAPAPVAWEVAADEEFADIVRTGVAVADPEYAHSVHVDAKGLESATTYFYRFHVGDWSSPVGRTRTLPAPDSSPDSLRFATASCQHWKDGYYTAHANLQEEDVDFVIFLGDYIYESGKEGIVRDHEAGVPYSLEEYRNRYGLYRTDPGLQGSHAAFPWYVIWDDHEVKNNRAGGREQDAEVEARQAAAYRAWWEHQAVRIPPPDGKTLPIHRYFEFGDLARIFLLDTRQYRDDQACGGGIGEPCDELDAPDRQLLGAAQEDWLLDGLSESETTWNVLAQQIVMSVLTFGGAIVNTDQWDGYPAARERILEHLKAEGIDNVIVLAGDIHTAGIGTMHETVDDVSTPVVTTEIVTTAVSSGSSYSEAIDQALALFLPQVEHIHYVDLIQRGYCRHTVTPEAWRVDFRAVETVAEPEAGIATVASFEVPRGATAEGPLDVTPS